MEVVEILDGLYMFSSYVPTIDLTFNQYLLTGKEPLLIHTGNNDSAVALAPKLKEILQDLTLSFIFVSHFESDECGGLKFLLDYFPKAKPVCSAVTARQLSGFSLCKEVIVKAPNERLQFGEYELEFLSYPSEMHLWEGLLALETARKIVFSSDLLIRRGKIQEFAVEANWSEEIKGISLEQVPNPSGREKLQRTLLNYSVRFAAPGHGPFLKLSK